MVRRLLGRWPPAIAVLLLALVEAVVGSEPKRGDGNAVIRRKAGASEIVVTTTSRVAGAVHSLTWGGREFIDSFDHGRQVQSAANFDAGQRFVPEVFNPTEAGALSDGTGKATTSKLLQFEASDREINSRVQMAFWLAPGETSLGYKALNSTRLSSHLLAKRMRLGYEYLSHAIELDLVFTVPREERHTLAQFEALTGYMPHEFERFWRLNIASQRLEPLDDGPGEQVWPVALATRDGSHAMGVYSPDQPSAGYEGQGYGRFRFPAEKVNKWNCVFRVRNTESIAGEHRFRVFAAVGTLDDVRTTLLALAERFRRR